MCGIFGGYGKGNLVSETLTGLKILEYRGYDSAGVAYITPDNQLGVVKAVGGLDKLATKLKNLPNTNLCLGHTRWATNGSVCETNSHPHLSHDGKIAVVHNGIIENYQLLKTSLLDHQIELKTNVDTEVIPNILYLLKHNKYKIHDYLQGQYVFSAVYLRPNPVLFLAKKGTLPLYIGRSNTAFYVASDTLAFPAEVTQIITLQDLDTCEINDHKITFHNAGKSITPAWQPFTQSFTATDKQGFDTYMAKEINEIPVVMEHIITTYQQDTNLLTQQQQFAKMLNSVKCIHVCGCGTSYHAALIIASLIEKYAHVRAKAHVSSELTANTLLNEPAFAIIISQSGETADTLVAMQLLQKHQIPIIALCNVTTSTIAKQSTLCFPLLCGPEIAVASTKVFCATLLVSCLLLGCFKPQNYHDLIKYTQTTLNQARQILPLPRHKSSKIFFVGKGFNYYLSLEAALKVKEITYTHCEGYPTNELKHGPLSMIDRDTLSIIYQSTTDNAVAEITARGGQVVIIPMDTQQNPLRFIAQIIPAQIFALDLATKLGIDPDKPRNLAKSVTVL